MLLANKKYDPVLLALSQWICRRWYLMGAYRKYKEKYQTPPIISQYINEENDSILPSPLLLALTDPTKTNTKLFETPINIKKEEIKPMERVFEFLVELIGKCPRGFRNIITYI